MEWLQDLEVALLNKAYIALIATTLVSALAAGCGAGPKAGLDRGKLVYDTCVPCHGEAGGGSMRLKAPDIAGMPQWYILRQLENFSKDVRGAHPDDMEGHRMRPMARTLYREGDKESVAAYVAGMPVMRAEHVLTQGDKAAGQVQFTNICATCHGADGMGNKDMGAPKLLGQSDWYMYSQLQKFHSGMRGAHPDDIYGAQMRAMSMTLVDTTAMLDVVAYIKTLPTK